MRPLGGIVILFAASLAAGRLQAQAPGIAGTWRGTSICVKETWNSACNDEQVLYRFTPLAGQPDSVALDAQKIVAGVPEPMGTLTLGYDAKQETWAAELRSVRYHLLWSYQVRDTVLTGTLLELPSRRVARHLMARKEQ